MTFEKTTSAGYLANHMARLFATSLHQQIKDIGLAPAQFMTLLELWERDGITQKELISRLDVEQATMANTITRMERDGLIVRKPHPDDRRAQLIFLTPHARQLQPAALRSAQGVNQKAMAGLSEMEKAAFVKTMTKVIQNLQKDGHKPEG